MQFLITLINFFGLNLFFLASLNASDSTKFRLTSMCNVESLSIFFCRDLISLTKDVELPIFSFLHCKYNENLLITIYMIHYLEISSDVPGPPLLKLFPTAAPTISFSIL